MKIGGERNCLRMISLSCHALAVLNIQVIPAENSLGSY